MQWYNEPRRWDERNGRIVVFAEGGTDFWRVTAHGFVKDDAHFYYRNVSGDFTATVETTGEYETLYDQAGLMIRESDTVWSKCGVEYVDNGQKGSAVITRRFSDWSIVPLDDDPESVWIRAERTGSAIEVSLSTDGDAYTMIRQGYLSEADTLQVGVMAAAPQGEGFEATFEGFAIE